jgi:peptidoglycan/LPS O-acetylase OafA/YrhL
VSPQNRHSGFLDLLRSVAITLVLLRHGISVNAGTNVSEPIAFIPKLATTFASNGWLGVDLFFVLSGYLLCSQIIHERQCGSWSPRNFYLRRAVRILPPYLTVLLVCWLGGLAFALGPDGVLSPFVLLTHLLFLQDYAGAPLLVTLWSLATEEKFYLAVPLLTVILMRAGHGRAAMLVLSLSAAVAFARTLSIQIDAPGSYPEFFWNYRAPFHFAIDGLFIGTAVAFAEKHAVLQSHRSRLLTLGCGAIALCGMFVLLLTNNWLEGPSFGSASTAIWCFAACCGVLIFAVRALKFEDRLPPLPKLVTQIAALSYSLYLVHYPVAVATQRLFAPENAPAEYWGTYLSLSLLLALMLNSLTEVPFRRLRARLRQQRVPEAEPRAAQTTATV